MTDETKRATRKADVVDIHQMPRFGAKASFTCGFVRDSKTGEITNFLRNKPDSDLPERPE